MVSKFDVSCPRGRRMAGPFIFFDQMRPVDTSCPLLMRIVPLSRASVARPVPGWVVASGVSQKYLTRGSAASKLRVTMWDTCEALVITEEQREVLQTWIAARNSPQKVVFRSQIVLARSTEFLCSLLRSSCPPISKTHRVIP